jgi:hypothetical protein
MRRRNSNRLPKQIYIWIQAAKNNDKHYADRQIWRINEFLSGLWPIFFEVIEEEELKLEQQGSRYRLTDTETQQLTDDN